MIEDDGGALVRDVMAHAAAWGVLLPVIAITAYTETRAGLAGAGFAEFIAKPFEPMKLCESVRRQVDRLAGPMS